MVNIFMVILVVGDRSEPHREPTLPHSPPFIRMNSAGVSFECEKNA